MCTTARRWKSHCWWETQKNGAARIWATSELLGGGSYFICADVNVGKSVIFPTILFEDVMFELSPEWQGWPANVGKCIPERGNSYFIGPGQPQAFSTLKNQQETKYENQCMWILMTETGSGKQSSGWRSGQCLSVSIDWRDPHAASLRWNSLTDGGLGFFLPLLLLSRCYFKFSRWF